MKQFLTFIIVATFCFFSFSNAPTNSTADNYKVTKTRNTSTGKTFDIKCTDCGKFITVYYKSKTKKYARGDSPWYTQHNSLDDAAEAGCDDKCD